MRQQVKLSVQIRPWDTLACCWDVRQPTNELVLRLPCLQCLGSVLHCSCYSSDYQCLLGQQSDITSTSFLLLGWKLVFGWCTDVPCLIAEVGGCIQISLCSYHVKHSCHLCLWACICVCVQLCFIACPAVAHCSNLLPTEQTHSVWYILVTLGCNPVYPPPRWPSGKASALRAEDPGFESRLPRDFFGVKSYQWLQNWHSSGYPARHLAL